MERENQKRAITDFETRLVPYLTGFPAPDFCSQTVYPRSYLDGHILRPNVTAIAYLFPFLRPRVQGVATGPGLTWGAFKAYFKRLYPK
jgi:hypothetical protein